MPVDKISHFSRTGELSDLEVVSEFVFLGSVLTDQRDELSEKLKD